MVGSTGEATYDQATTSVYKLRLKDARADAMRAMLRVAVSAAATGAEVATVGRDPFGDGPFEFTKTPDGYELRSKINIRLSEAGPNEFLRSGAAVLVVRTLPPGK